MDDIHKVFINNLSNFNCFKRLNKTNFILFMNKFKYYFLALRNVRLKNIVK